MRAPPNNPLQLPFVATGIDAAQHPFFNGCSAPPAACVIASENVRRLPGAAYPRGDANEREPIGPHALPRDVHDLLDVDVADPLRGCMPAIDQATARYSLLMPATFFTLVAGYFASRQMFVEDLLPRTA